MKRTFRLLLAAIVVTLLIGCQESAQSHKKHQKRQTGTIDKAFYVSPGGNDRADGSKSTPFQTISRAQNAVRRLIHQRIQGTVTVHILPGEYLLKDTLTFNEMDSGSRNLKIVYKGTDAFNKPVITSGRKITDWNKCELNGKPGWWTKIRDVYSGDWYFRQVFADGKRLIRARHPNVGDGFLTLKEIKEPNNWRTQQSFLINETLPFGNLAQHDAEAGFLHYWSMSRNWLRSTAENEIETEFPVGVYGAPLCMPKAGHSRIFIEHAMVLVDEPGEWFLDRDSGKLYLMLAPGENPNRMEITAPTLKRLLVVCPKGDRPIRNLHFRNLDFAYTSWKLPLAGYHGLQAGTYTQTYLVDNSYMLDCAVYFENVQNGSFESCRVAHTGTNGLGVGPYSRNFKIRGNEIDDIGANGIIIGYRDEVDEPPRKQFENDWKEPEMAPVGIETSHNRIHRCGQIHFGAVGYFEFFCTSSVFAHNEVYDLPYTGLTIGMTWNHLPSTQRDSRVEYNHIHDVMKLMYDGGAIYTLGYQPGTVVRNNLIENVVHGHGLYTDEGSSRILFENNLVVDAGVYGYQHHYGHSNVLRNNIFYSPDSAGVYNVVEKGKPAFTFENNIVVLEEMGQADHWFHHYEPAIEKPQAIRELRVVDRKAQFRNNLYFQTNGEEMVFVDGSFGQWQNAGMDKGSMIADPKFADPKNGDFSLAADSPAFEIGFKPFDLSNVGPQM